MRYESLPLAGTRRACLVLKVARLPRKWNYLLCKPNRGAVTDEESQFVKNSLTRVFSNRISSSTAAAVPLPRWGRQGEVRLAQGDTGLGVSLRTEMRYESLPLEGKAFSSRHRSPVGRDGRFSSYFIPVRARARVSIFLYYIINYYCNLKGNVLK